MNNLRQIYGAESLIFGKIIDPVSGEMLLPIMVVDSARLALDGLGAIRMQAWQNREAAERTFASGLVTFFSRTTGKLWVKGETSGNVLRLRAAYADCDMDSLLLDAAAVGPTCHTGADSCFAIKTIGE